MFDGDAAGRNAALKCIDNSLGCPQLEVRVVSLPEGTDPDQMLQQQQNLDSYIEQADDLIEYGIRSYLKNSTSTSVPEIVEKQLLPWIQSQQNPVRKDYLLHKLSENTGISFQTLSQTVGKSNSTIEQPSSNPGQPTKPIVPALTYECIGHLFFAAPGVPSERVLHFLRRLPLNHDLANTIAFCLKHLSEGNSPSSMDPTLWPESILNQIEEDKQAFECRDHWVQLEILSWFHEAKSHKKTIYQLGTQVETFASDPEKIHLLSQSIREHQQKHDHAILQVSELRNSVL